MSGRAPKETNGYAHDNAVQADLMSVRGAGRENARPVTPSQIRPRRTLMRNIVNGLILLALTPCLATAQEGSVRRVLATLAERGGSVSPAVAPSPGTTQPPANPTSAVASCSKSSSDEIREACGRCGIHVVAGAMAGWKTGATFADQRATLASKASSAAWWGFAAAVQSSDCSKCVDEIGAALNRVDPVGAALNAMLERGRNGRGEGGGGRSPIEGRPGDWERGWGGKVG